MGDESRKPWDRSPRFPGIRKWVLAAGSLVVLAGCGYAAVGWYVRSSSAETLKEAERFVLKKDPASAQKTLAWLLWFEPANPEALLLRGLSLHVAGELQSSIDTFERIPEKAAAHEEASFALSATLLRDAQFDRAEEVLLRHLELYPRADKARYKLKWLYETELRPRDVVELLKDRLRLLPNDLKVLPDLLNAEVFDPNPHEFFGYLEEIEQRRPGQASVRLSLGYCHWLMGHIRRADKLLRSALAQKPDDPRTRFLAAGFFVDQGDIDLAEQVLERPRASSGEGTGGSSYANDDRYWSLRSQIAKRRGQLDEALQQLNRALALRPLEPEYVARKARLLQRLGRKQEAGKMLELVVQLDRAHTELVVVQDYTFPKITAAQCEKIVKLCERLGKWDQAAGWRIVLQNLKKMARDPILEPPLGLSLRSGVEKLQTRPAQ